MCGQVVCEEVVCGQVVCEEVVRCKLYVDKLCVTCEQVVCVLGGRAGGRTGSGRKRAEAGGSAQKQEPHTKMWGIVCVVARMMTAHQAGSRACSWLIFLGWSKKLSQLRGTEPATRH